MAILVPELHQPASVSGNIPQGLFLIPLPFVDDLRDPPGYDINRGMFCYVLSWLLVY